MSRWKMLFPLAFVAACAPSDNASSQAVPASVGRVWFYGFEVQRITGLFEEEMERYGCPFEITRAAFDRAVSPERFAEPYNSKDVQAKIVFGSETVFIDRFGTARRVGGREFLVDKEQFASSLVAAGPCPQVR